MMKADWGEIWLSKDIFKHEKENYEIEFLDKFKFKGKADKIPAYKLKSKKAKKEKTYEGKFVGRTKEIEQASLLFEPLEKGNLGGIFYVYGGAGVGKSRFVYELKQRHQNYNWLFLPCDGILRKPFNPFNHFLSTFFDQSSENTKTQNQENFDTNFQNFIDDLDKTKNEEIKNELIRLKSILAGTLGLVEEYEDCLYNQLDAKLRYENTLFAFKEVFKGLSRIKPIVLEIEDLQWIEDDSVNAIKVLSRDIDAFPIMMIASSRYYDDGTKPSLHLDIPTLEINLNTLSIDGLKEIAEERLGGKISEKLLENLHQKTEGNPFFIEQTVFYYRESQIISFDEKNQIWDLEKEEAIIPKSINDLLIARIDRLSDKLKEAVQTASVVGQEFDIKLLLEILRQIGKTWRPTVLDFELKKGEENNLWAILSEIKGVFAHAMMQDVAYKMQLHAKLRIIHKTIAELLEKLFPDNKQVYSDLAHHYERAEIRDKTIEYLEKAGDFAKDNFQNTKALEFYEKLDGLMQDELGIAGGDTGRLEITEDNKKKIKRYIDLLVLKKNHILMILGQINKAKDNVHLALDLAKKLDDKDKIGLSMLELGSLLIHFGEYKKAMEYLQSSLDIFDETHNLNKLGLCFMNIGEIYRLTGDSKKSLEYYEKNLNICKKLKNEVGIANTLGYIGRNYDYSGDIEKAKEYYEEQLKMWDKLNNKSGIADAIGNLGIIYFYSNDNQKALEYYEKQLEICRELGSKIKIANAMCNIGLVYYEQKDYNKAMKFYQNYFNISSNIGDKVSIANAIANIAHTFKALGDYQKAMENYNNGLEIVKSLQIKYLETEYLVEKAELLFLKKDYAEARRLNSEGLKVAEEIGHAEYITKGKKVLGKLNAVF